MNKRAGDAVRSGMAVVMLQGFWLAFARTGLVLVGCLAQCTSPSFAQTPPNRMGVSFGRAVATALPVLVPRIAFTAPRNDAVLSENRVEVRLNVSNWRNVLDANDRRYITVVLDDESPRRVDDPRQPMILENLSTGTHLLRAFPNWRTNEPVRSDGAYAAVAFHVGQATRRLEIDPQAPSLVYLQPVGEYGGDRNRIFLDFYLTNLPVNEIGANGYRVRPSIDGRMMDDLTVWAPYYIMNLPVGEHTVGLHLIDPNGRLVPGPFSSAHRGIRVTQESPFQCAGCASLRDGQCVPLDPCQERCARRDLNSCACAIPACPSACQRMNELTCVCMPTHAVTNCEQQRECRRYASEESCTGMARVAQGSGCWIGQVNCE